MHFTPGTIESNTLYDRSCTHLIVAHELILYLTIPGLQVNEEHEFKIIILNNNINLNSNNTTNTHFYIDRFI